MVGAPSPVLILTLHLHACCIGKVVILGYVIQKFIDSQLVFESLPFQTSPLLTIISKVHATAANCMQMPGADKANPHLGIEPGSLGLAAQHSDHWATGKSWVQ